MPPGRPLRFFAAGFCAGVPGAAGFAFLFPDWEAETWASIFAGSIRCCLGWATAPDSTRTPALPHHTDPYCGCPRRSRDAQTRIATYHAPQSQYASAREELVAFCVCIRSVPAQRAPFFCPAAGIHRAEVAAAAISCRHYTRRLEFGATTRRRAAHRLELRVALFHTPPHSVACPLPRTPHRLELRLRAAPSRQMRPCVESHSHFGSFCGAWTLRILNIAELGHCGA